VRRAVASTSRSFASFVVVLLMPMGQILHMSMKCVLDLTSADLQTSEMGIDVFPSLTI
jgi:hypothetical protein